MMPILYLFYSGTSVKKGFFKGLIEFTAINQFSKAFKCSKYNMQLAQANDKTIIKSLNLTVVCMLLKYNWRSNVTIVKEPGAKELFTF